MSLEVCKIELGKPLGKFTSALFKELNASPALKDNNFIFSPFSIHAVLSVLFAGARTNTATQLEQAIFLRPGSNVTTMMEAYKHHRLSGVESDPSTLHIANKMYVLQNAAASMHSFLATTGDAFDSVVEAVEKFSESTRGPINTWVETVTQGKIQNLIPSGVLNNLTRLVIVNAIYFKGEWKEKFEINLTEMAPFSPLSGPDVQVAMMENEAKYQVTPIKDLSARALRMPYKGDRFSMIFVLSDTANEFGAMQAKLSDPQGFNLLDITFGRPKKVSVRVPKFKIETEVELTQALQKMGVTDLFIDGIADLSGIDGTRGLSVSLVQHKGVIEVNEEGAEAAAATAAVVMMRSMPMPEDIEEFFLDRPFFFAITDQQLDIVLFAGCVMNPGAKST